MAEEPIAGSIPRTPTVFITDAADESSRVADTLRAAGYAVVDVPLSLLVSRVGVQRPQVVLDPRIEQSLRTRGRADGANRDGRPEFRGQLPARIGDGAIAIVGADEIGLAQDDHGRNGGLLQAVQRRDVVFGERGRGVDQHACEVAAWQIRQRLSRA